MNHQFVKSSLPAPPAAGATAGQPSMARDPKNKARRPASDHGGAPSTSNEDYLERIDELIESKGYARVVDIAAKLAVSQPSVTAMVKRLADAGYLHYERYRGMVMTEKGRAVARQIKDRHATLKRFLSLLGVDPQTQERDIEGLEHSLSPATLACLDDLADFLESRPEVVAAFVRRRKIRKALGEE